MTTSAMSGMDMASTTMAMATSAMSGMDSTFVSFFALNFAIEVLEHVFKARRLFSS